MRWGLVVAACALAGCADSRLGGATPVGVDLSGHWTLNVADSDDAQRLMQSQIAQATAGASGDGDGDGGGGPRGGSRRGGLPGMPAGAMGPMMPPVSILDESLRWPGRDLTLTQNGGGISFVSDGETRSCHPGALKNGFPHRPTPDSGRRNTPTRGRGDAPQPRCGWEERSLVVRSGEADEDSPPFEQRFSLSADGQRLVEVVVFRGGRSNGFVASREWDRDRAQAPPAAARAPAGQ